MAVDVLQAVQQHAKEIATRGVRVPVRETAPLAVRQIVKGAAMWDVIRDVQLHVLEDVREVVMRFAIPHVAIRVMDLVAEAAWLHVMVGVMGFVDW